MTAATLATAARSTLGVIRILNGGLGLLAPEFVIRRFGDEKPGSNPAAIYGLRLFGIRTVVLGLDLLRLRGADRDRATQAAVLIHASDTATVLMLLQQGQLPADRARPLLLISGGNTVLAIVAALAGRAVP